MNNRHKQFAMRMAVLVLCLLVFASALSSCSTFTEIYLAEYADGYYDYDPGDTSYVPDRTYRVIGQTNPRWELDKTPETTLSETTRKPTTTKTPSTTRKPTTQAPTTTRLPQTTRAPQTTTPVTTDNIPDEFQNHIYLEAKNSGRCSELVGDVLVTVILVKDSESSWGTSDTNALKKSLSEQEAELEKAAAKYGKKLDITFSYVKASYSGKISSGDDPASWQDPVAKSAGFTSLNKAQSELDNSNDADANPIAFLLNKSGRAYANWYFSLNGTERMSVFSSDLDAFSHELCHLFGAQDYYFPADVEEAADKYIPDSLMNSGDKVDALTAFCIGWDDELDKNAYNFLSATAHITKEYLNSENEKQQTTGNVTNFQLSYGIYTGYLDRGVPNGQGSIKYDNGNSYEGGFLNGNQHGRGVFRWSDGIVYDGDWVNGNRTGKGTLTWADGAVYSGDWVNNERTGKGILVWASGDKYEGDFVNGSRTGQGTYTGISGYKYTGGWKNDKCHGYGKATYTNKSTYEGYFVDGIRTGQGTYISENGYTYIGEWKNDTYQGYGKATYTDKSTYEGYFVSGERHGQGTYIYASGHKYVGAWENGNRTGYGVMYWSDGSSYEGYWQDNKRHGYGKYINKSGTVFEGQWVNDQFQ